MSNQSKAKSPNTQVMQDGPAKFNETAARVFANPEAFGASMKSTVPVQGMHF